MRIACLVHKKEIADCAWRVLTENGVDWRAYHLSIEYGPTNFAIEWAQRMEVSANKPDIIIARGLQAIHIKRNCTIPVVEIRLTAQEMSLLILQAKAIAGKEHPRIGVVGYTNTYCNMDYFGEIFDIDLHPYMVKDDQGDRQALHACAKQAIWDKMDVIIGGQLAQQEATAGGIPNLYITSTGDSFLEAFRAAKNMAYAIEKEQLNSSSMMTLLDNSFSAMICFDSAGKVTLINHLAEIQLGMKPVDVTGKPVQQIINDLSSDILNSVLADGRMVFSLYIDIGQHSMVANISPIVVENHVAGGMISAQQVSLVEEMGSVARQHQASTHRAAATLQSIGEPSTAIRRLVATAKQYASSEFPVLIFSQPGNGQERFAEAIHNQSKQKNGAFVTVNCAEITEDEQMQMLFAPANEAGGLVRMANGGTLYLENIHALIPSCQQRLLSLVKNKLLIDTHLRRERISVRIIASSTDTLPKLVRDGQFDQELFFILNTLPLEIPPLRERKDDIYYWANQFLIRYREKYKRYITLTSGGNKQLAAYSWSGNTIQLRSFCQNLILTAKRRTIDEVDIRRLYEKMYPLLPSDVELLPQRYVSPDSEADLIAQLLSQYHGNRSQVAAAMNISTTTLWRKIKRYNLKMEEPEEEDLPETEEDAPK